MKRTDFPLAALLASLAVTLLAAGCGGTATSGGSPGPALPGGLSLEEHALAGPPALEPLSFTPVEGRQEGILERHALLRSERIPDRLVMVAGNPSIDASWGDGTLTATAVVSNPETREMTIELRAGDEVLFSAPAGFPSPATPLQALWTYDGHWALEILLATPDEWQGEVYLDGRLLNDEYGYQEAFGLQLLAGKLFYFYQRGGRIGISYAGVEADLGYSELPHYGCCSASVLNPQQAESMVAFFAKRDATWYYVELGRFE